MTRSNAQADRPREACGVFGIINHPNAAELTRLGLYALQHRGQESAGIFLMRDGKCEIHKGMGLVTEVFPRLPREWRDGVQTMAIGHVRYSTAGSSSIENAQPFDVEFDKWHLAIAHNGNLSNGGILRDDLKSNGAIFRGNTDTETILHQAVRRHVRGETPWAGMKAILPDLEGAYSLLAMCEDGVAAIRDPHGFRPLAMGRLDDAVVFASETSAMDLIGAVYERDVEPGEFILVRPDGTVDCQQLNGNGRLAHCIFELIYFARPDSRIFNECVYSLRKGFGARLAQEAPVDADVVMPIPDGGTYAALGFAEAAGIPFDMGIMRNHYVGRTFIKPKQEDRKASVHIKLNPITEAIKGKRVCLVDDSIVRGTTTKEKVRLLRECGAREVHMRVSCPPHVSPCHYGIDFPSKGELIANQYDIEGIRDLLDVDTLAYLSQEGMLQVVGDAEGDRYCHACFSGEYPVEPKQSVERI